MIFQATWKQMLDGSKWQTRRICITPPQWPIIGKEYDFEIMIDDSDMWCPVNVYNTNYPGDGVYRRHFKAGGWLSGDYCVEPDWWDTAKWIIGHSYAVQPGRGKKALGYRKLIDIRLERLQDITEEDAIAEGCTPCMAMDGTLLYSARSDYQLVWIRLHAKSYEQWAANPLVWVLEFEHPQVSDQPLIAEWGDETD